MNNQSRECYMGGYAVCMAYLNDNNYNKQLICTHITVPAVYKSDWQCDAHCWHDEGTYEFDLDNAEPTDSEEYRLIREDGGLMIGKGRVTKIIEVLKENVQEI